MTIISQGAEATLILQDNLIIKKRTPKSYRLPILDKKIRRFRTKREIKVLGKLEALGICVPRVFTQPSDTEFVMEFIDGKRLRDVLLEDPSQQQFFSIVGKWLAIMHEEGIIHGDLTTSNVLISSNGLPVLIDCGLSFFSSKIEDKAVDIHLLFQAIQSTHYNYEQEFQASFLEAYCAHSPHAQEVLGRLTVVGQRGKNK